MKLPIVGEVRKNFKAIDPTKTLFLILVLSNFYSCVFEKSDLKINIVNLSKEKIYIGGLGLDVCDSCIIMRDIKWFQQSDKSEQLILRILKSKDSLQLQDKLISNQIKIYTINVDSLDGYFRHGYRFNISKKPWVQILSGNVDRNKKTCRIVIK